jgi:hypothetical protein
MAIELTTCCDGRAEQLTTACAVGTRTARHANWLGKHAPDRAVGGVARIYAAPRRRRFAEDICTMELVGTSEVGCHGGACAECDMVVDTLIAVEPWDVDRRVWQRHGYGHARLVEHVCSHAHDRLESSAECTLACG